MKIDVHARRFKLTDSLRAAVHREIHRLAQAVCSLPGERAPKACSAERPLLSMDPGYAY